MKKKTLTRGIALAMLLVFTMTAFIVPTSAKVQTMREYVTPDDKGYYPSFYDIKMTYGSTARYLFEIDVDENTFDSLGVDVSLADKEYNNRVLQNISDGFYSIDDFSNSEIVLNGDFTIGGYGYTSVRPIVEYEAEAQSGLINTMFGGFGNTIKGITNGIKTMFNNILYVDGTSSSGLSAFAKFGFVMSGLTMALGLGYVIINKIR